jgi:hypothetical protein
MSSYVFINSKAQSKGLLLQIVFGVCENELKDKLMRTKM